MIGRNCRAVRSVRVVPAARKALVAALTLTMLTGGVPAPAWALAADEAQAALADVARDVVPDATGALGEGASSGVAADNGASSENAEEAVEAGSDAGESKADDGIADADQSKDDDLGDSTASLDEGQDSPSGSSTSSVVSTARAARSGIDADYIYIHDDATDATLSKVGVGQVLRVDATYEDSDWGDEWDFSDSDYDGMTFQWYAGGQRVSYASGDAAWKTKGYEPIEDATGRTFTVSEDLSGKYLAARVVNPGGSVVWVSASTPQVTDGKTDLTRVTISGKVKVGSSLHAIAYEEGGWSGEREVTAGVTFRWLAAPSQDGEFAAIEGASGAELALDAVLAGKYIKVEATSRNAVTSAAAGPVATVGSAENEAKLARAIEALESDNYRPNPQYGTDANLNEMIEARLVELGVTGITSQVIDAGMEASDPAGQGSIDVSAGSTNGDITYFFLAPAEKTPSLDYSILRRFQPTYRLTCGDASDTFTPGRTSTLAWDEQRVESYLKDASGAAVLPDELVAGSISENTGKLTLPSKVVDAKTGKKIADISWGSSNAKVAKVTSGWDSDYSPICTVSFTHGATPAQVTLTATFKMTGASGLSEKTVTVKHSLTVDARSSATEEQVKSELTDILKKATVTAAGDGSAVDPASVSGDLQLPTPRSLGVDGKAYKLSYASSDPSVIRINGYRGVVTGNLEGGQTRSATLSVQIAYDGVSVTRELGTFTPAVVTTAEIDEAVAFMEQVKAAYGAALLGSNASADAVTGNLATFQSASPAADGSIAWARTSADCDDAGVVPVDLPGYDSMGSQKWRTFRSSREAVVTSENLLVTQPEYNTRVSVDSSLTYKKYESLAAAHPDDERLQKLVNQPVSATFTVVGATGAEDPDPGRTLTVNARVTGLSAAADDGMRTQEDWIPLTEVEVPVDDDATAWDVFAKLLDEAGYTYETNAYGPTSITAPDGRTLDSSFTEPYRYWAFYVDGTYGQGDEGSATTCRLKDGMTVELRYLDEGAQTSPSGGVTVNPDAEHPDLDVQWNGFVNGGAGAVTDALTPTENGELAWAESLLTKEEVAAGATSSASDPLIIDGKIYIVSASTAYDSNWNKVESLARLQVIDRASGAIERTVELGAKMDSTCRPAYADGIIVIPLTGGYLQAVSAKTLETLWVVPASTQGQSLCTLTVRDGHVYVSTFDAYGDGEVTASGAVKRYDLRTGALASSIRNDDAGYYWAGGVNVGDYFVIGDDAGVVHVFTADLSREVSSADVSDCFIRTTLVESDGFVYAVTRDDGVLHKLSINDDGVIGEVGKVKIATYSTSTPAIAGGYAFVGGLGEGKKWLAPGMLTVVDLSSMSVVASITKADGEDIRGEIKSAPLVSVQNGETYVYFTSNKVSSGYDAGGGVYVYRMGDSEASVLFQPNADMVQYCFASVICDEEGNLYYTNDSGHLFKIAGHGAGQGGDAGGDTDGGQGGQGGDAGGGQGGGTSQGGDQDGDTGGSQAGDQGENGAKPGEDDVAGGHETDDQQDQADAQTDPDSSNVPTVQPAVPAGSKPLAKAPASADKGQAGSDASGESGEPAEGQVSNADAGGKATATVASVNAGGQIDPGAGVALAAGAAGSVGLVATGVWTVSVRRRKGV